MYEKLLYAITNATTIDAGMFFIACNYTTVLIVINNVPDWIDTTDGAQYMARAGTNLVESDDDEEGDNA
jgi:hypothetical protein